MSMVGKKGGTRETTCTVNRSEFNPIEFNAIREGGRVKGKKERKGKGDPRLQLGIIEHTRKKNLSQEASYQSHFVRRNTEHQKRFKEKCGERTRKAALK